MGYLCRNFEENHINIYVEVVNKLITLLNEIQTIPPNAVH